LPLTGPPVAHTLCCEAAQLSEVRQALQEANAALEAYRQRETVFQSENQLRVKAQETVKQLQARVAQLEKDVAQRDEALVDMAQELGKSKLRVSTLAQFKATAQQEAWVDDTTVDNCQLCNSAFNLVNRKVRRGLVARMTLVARLAADTVRTDAVGCRGWRGAPAPLPALRRRVLQQLQQPAHELAQLRAAGTRVRHVRTLAPEQTLGGIACTVDVTV